MNRDPSDTLFSRSRDRSGVDRIALSHAGSEELFFTAELGEGETPAGMLGRAAAAVAADGAQIICQDVAGMKSFGLDGGEEMDRAVGRPSWPVTWIENSDRPGSPSRLCGTQIWAVKGLDLERIESHGRIVGTTWTDQGMRWCRLGGLQTGDPGAPRVEQATGLLEEMESVLQRTAMDFSNVARTWFFFDDILAWYREFNPTRDAFFRSRGVFDGLVPASTGIGGADRHGPALEAGLLAVEPAAGSRAPFPLPSPLQCPAIDYGSSFSRAVEIDLPGQRRLLVSGTASIDAAGEAVHVGNTEAQVAHTLDVVQAILESRGAGWGDVVRAIVYFKNHEEVPLYHERIASLGVDPLPALFVQNDVCWDELLFEIEVDALVAPPE